MNTPGRSGQRSIPGSFTLKKLVVSEELLEVVPVVLRGDECLPPLSALSAVNQPPRRGRTNPARRQVATGDRPVIWTVTSIMARSSSLHVEPPAQLSS